jgi:hypothetical protein
VRKKRLKYSPDLVEYGICDSVVVWFLFCIADGVIHIHK